MRVLGALVGGLVWFVAFGAPHVSGQVEQSGVGQNDEPADPGTSADACVLACVQSVLEQHGEAIVEPGDQPRRVLTWPHMVDADELARLAVLSGPVQSAWSNGMYQIQVTLTPGVAGRTRLDVETRLVGRHDVSLPLLRPSPWERLESSGVLEQEVRDALTACPDATEPTSAP